MTTAQELARWAKKAREATERRDELIGQMRAEGEALRTIADAAGLSHTAIAKVLAKNTT